MERDKRGRFMKGVKSWNSGLNKFNSEKVRIIGEKSLETRKLIKENNPEKYLDWQRKISESKSKTISGFKGHNMGLCRKCNKTHKVWNKGLTKETDERVKSFSEKTKGRKFTDEWKQNMSEARKGKTPKNFFSLLGHNKRGLLCDKCGKVHKKSIGMTGHNFGLCKKCEKKHIAKKNRGFSGRKHSNESKLIMSQKAKKLKGRKVTWGEKVSKTLKKRYQNGTIIHPLIGKKHKQETIEKIKKSKESIEIKEKYRQNRLRQVFPFKDTKIEIKLQEALKKESINFETHKPILGQPDIFIEPNICVFADGCYWHSCEKCVDKNKMDNRQRYAKTKDLVITQKLANEGYIVLRFWEHEIHTDINSCISKIKEMFIHGYSI